jgi:hypothetical protein
MTIAARLAHLEAERLDQARRAALRHSGVSPFDADVDSDAIIAAEHAYATALGQGDDRAAAVVAAEQAYIAQRKIDRDREAVTAPVTLDTDTDAAIMVDRAGHDRPGAAESEQEQDVVLLVTPPALTPAPPQSCRACRRPGHPSCTVCGLCAVPAVDDLCTGCAREQGRPLPMRAERGIRRTNRAVWGRLWGDDDDW